MVSQSVRTLVRAASVANDEKHSSVVLRFASLPTPTAPHPLRHASGPSEGRSAREVALSWSTSPAVKSPWDVAQTGNLPCFWGSVCPYVMLEQSPEHSSKQNRSNLDAGTGLPCDFGVERKNTLSSHTMSSLEDLPLNVERETLVFFFAKDITKQEMRGDDSACIPRFTWGNNFCLSPICQGGFFWVVDWATTS